MANIHDYLTGGKQDIIPLLCMVLEKTYAQLISHSNDVLDAHQKKRLKTLIKEREKGVPFAYLSGTQGFYHLDFKVTPDTLIPRPETELLIDIALDLFKNKPCNLLDLGTGSGAIAITLADKNPDWQVTATDASPKALEVAKQNATTDINFRWGNWFAAVPQQTFDLIICNPPYVETNSPYLRGLAFEPQNALVSGKDGLNDIRIIIDNSPKFLANNGYLLLEHGHTQRVKIIGLLTENFHQLKTFKDYNLHDRAILAQLKG